MRGAARAAEMTEEEVALEKLKGLAEKEAARKAATGQAGTAKRAAEDAKRWAATGQADKDKHAGVDAARMASTGQAGTDKTRTKAKVISTIVAASKTQAPWMTKRWMSTSTETAMPGITNACSPQPRHAPDLSSAPDMSSTAPRNCAPHKSHRTIPTARIAPRNSRRAIRAAQPRLHTAPIL
jgi:hypothetical protein